MEKRKIGWTVLLASITFSSFLFAHPATTSEQGESGTATHASDLAGVWVQKIPSSHYTRLGRFCRATRLEKLSYDRRLGGGAIQSEQGYTRLKRSCVVDVDGADCKVPAAGSAGNLYGFRLSDGDHTDSRPSAYVFRVRQLCAANFLPTDESIRT